MKKIIILIISLMYFVFLFIGCNPNDTSSSSKKINNKPIVNKPVVKNQKYNFGPMADLAKIDDETKMKLQNILNNLGESKKDSISFNIIGVSYNKDGSLIVDLFIRNGNSYSVFNIDSQLDVIKDGKSIASASFNFIKEDFGTLEANTSRPWTILYYPEDLKVKDTEIKDKELLGKIVLNGKKVQYEY